MLIQFNFENHKTYLNETSLDMSATAIKEHEDNCFTASNGEKYLKVAAIYGANGSGKTNVLDAFNKMRVHMRDYFRLGVFSSSATDGDNRFRFCASGAAKPASYEVFILTKGIEYQYGFSFDGKVFIDEWLSKKSSEPKSRFKKVFKRSSAGISLEKELSYFKEVLKILDNETLVLSFLSKFMIEDVKNVYAWFKQTKVLMYGSDSYEDFSAHSFVPDVLEDKQKKKKFLDFLKAIDVRIDDVVFKSKEEGSLSRYPINTVRINGDTGERIEAPLDIESSGTMKTISMYKRLVDTLDDGGTLFVDELDAKLHPLLTKYIVNLFHNTESNQGNGQLIFTTHNTEILTKDLFRRDQIWFSDKAETGVSELYSLVEFVDEEGKKIRNDASYKKDYLAGRYGALPSFVDKWSLDDSE